MDSRFLGNDEKKEALRSTPSFPRKRESIAPHDGSRAGTRCFHPQVDMVA